MNLIYLIPFDCIQSISFQVIHAMQSCSFTTTHGRWNENLNITKSRRYSCNGKEYTKRLLSEFEFWMDMNFGMYGRNGQKFSRVILTTRVLFGVSYLVDCILLVSYTLYLIRSLLLYYYIEKKRAPLCLEILRSHISQKVRLSITKSYGYTNNTNKLIMIRYQNDAWPMRYNSTQV